MSQEDQIISSIKNALDFQENIVYTNIENIKPIQNTRSLSPIRLKDDSFGESIEETYDENTDENTFSSSEYYSEKYQNYENFLNFSVLFPEELSIFEKIKWRTYYTAGWIYHKLF